MSQAKDSHSKKKILKAKRALREKFLLEKLNRFDYSIDFSDDDTDGDEDETTTQIYVERESWRGSALGEIEPMDWTTLMGTEHLEHDELRARCLFEMKSYEHLVARANFYRRRFGLPVFDAKFVFPELVDLYYRRDELYLESVHTAPPGEQNALVDRN